MAACGPASVLTVALAHDILRFWFGDMCTWDRNSKPPAHRDQLWWGGGDEVDATIRRHFGALLSTLRREGVAHALGGTPAQGGSEGETLRVELARIIVHDQFSRNVHRGTAAAFASDPVACALSQRLVAAGRFRRVLRLFERFFLILPLHHAEDLGCQDLYLEELRALESDASDTETARWFEAEHRFGRTRRDEIARVGRITARDAALGRASTRQETQCLGSRRSSSCDLTEVPA